MSFQYNTSSDKSCDNWEQNMEFDTEEIRPPDKVKREILVDNSSEDWIPIQKKTQEELEIEEAIRISNQEIDDMCEAQMQKIINEIQERKNKFQNIIFIFKRLSKFDKEVEEVYDMIEYIIDRNITGDIERHSFDKMTYDRIFKTIHNIRFNEVEIETLTKLFYFE